MFEGVVGELRAVVRRSVAVITGSIECDRAVTCGTEMQSGEYTEPPPDIARYLLNNSANTSLSHLSVDHSLAAMLTFNTTTGKSPDR